MFLFLDEPRRIPPGAYSLSTSKGRDGKREAAEIAHFVALAALRFRWAMRHLRAARATESEEWRLIQEAKCSEQLLRVGEELAWVRATAFDVCSVNPAYSSHRAEAGEESGSQYLRCGHQHPTISEAEACIIRMLGAPIRGSVRVYGTSVLDEWWTPEEGRLIEFYRQRAHDQAVALARTTPPRKITYQEMSTQTGVTSCSIIGCGSLEAPGDTRLCLPCHHRIHLEANPEAKLPRLPGFRMAPAVASPPIPSPPPQAHPHAPQPTGQLRLF